MSSSNHSIGRAGHPQDKDISHGDSCVCDGCEKEIRSWDVVELPPWAFKKQMYDACFVDLTDNSGKYREKYNTLVLYHEEPVDLEE